MTSLRSECALRSLGLFGLTTDDAARIDEEMASRASAHAQGIDRSLRGGQVALVMGPSAAGKSSILRALARYASSVVQVCVGNEDAGMSVIDALAPSPDDLPDALRALSAAGLADAFIPARRIGQLSEGERARFAIVLAILSAERRLACGESPTVLLDDFADNLDEATAISVCHGVRRWLERQPRARMVTATLRSGLARHLRPEIVIDLSERGMGLPAHDVATASSESHSQHVAPDVHVTIERGTLGDYDALARHHYRAGRPATVVQVLVARIAGDERETRFGEPGYPGRDNAEPAAVLTISMPTLNGAWRARVWPEIAASRGDKRCAAMELNRSVRCISRVIVHPQMRARGVGMRLIREYLAHPLTVRTEALSAMGAVSPLFVRAGMTEWMLPHARRDLKLIDALSAADLRPWMLADLDLALERAARFPHLERALRIWAMAHGHTRGLAQGPVRDLVRGAAKQIIAARRAYTHG